MFTKPINCPHCDTKQIGFMNPKFPTNFQGCKNCGQLIMFATEKKYLTKSNPFREKFQKIRRLFGLN